MDQKTDSKAFQLFFAGGVKYLSFLLVLHKNSIYICPHKLSISFGKLPGWANRPVVGCVLEKRRRIPVDVFLFSCLSSFHFKWTWTHSNEVKKICDGCLRVWLSVSSLSVQLFLLVCAVVPASDLHPLIHKLPLPESCLSSWEISPTSCASVFFHPLTLHLLPRPPCLSLTHTLTLASLVFFFSFFLSHTLWSTPYFWDLILFFCFLRRLVSLSHECWCSRYPSSSPSTSPLNMCEAVSELVSFVYV